MLKDKGREERSRKKQKKKQHYGELPRVSFRSNAALIISILLGNFFPFTIKNREKRESKGTLESKDKKRKATEGCAC